MRKTLSFGRAAEVSSRQKTLSYFEFWPGWLFYAPIRLYGLWLAWRFGGVTVLAAANPLFDAGGLVGESKSQILRQIPAQLGDKIAAFVVVKRSDDNIQTDVSAAKQILADHGLTYPLVAKPDIGCRGMGVQRLMNDTDLTNYLSQFPVGYDVMLQQLHDYPCEVGLFYVRHPDWQRGIIFSLTLKHFATVTGDGKTTLRRLIETDSRAGKIAHLYLTRHRARWDWVVPAGEIFRIAFAGSHSRGTIFKDGAAKITPALVENWDRFCQQIPEFYFGRFDVRYQQWSDLEQAQNVKIVELNGAGAEATHIWDAACTLRHAYATLFQQFRHGYTIGAKNIRRGFRAMTITELRQRYALHQRLAKLYPPTD